MVTGTSVTPENRPALFVPTLEVGSALARVRRTLGRSRRIPGLAMLFLGNRSRAAEARPGGQASLPWGFGLSSALLWGWGVAETGGVDASGMAPPPLTTVTGMRPPSMLPAPASSPAGSNSNVASARRSGGRALSSEPPSLESRRPSELPSLESRRSSEPHRAGSLTHHLSEPQPLALPPRAPRASDGGVDLGGVAPMNSKIATSREPDEIATPTEFGLSGLTLSRGLGRAAKVASSADVLVGLSRVRSAAPRLGGVAARMTWPERGAPVPQESVARTATVPQADEPRLDPTGRQPRRPTENTGLPDGTHDRSEIFPALTPRVRGRDALAVGHPADITPSLQMLVTKQVTEEIKKVATSLATRAPELMRQTGNDVLSDATVRHVMRRMQIISQEDKFRSGKLR